MAMNDYNSFMTRQAYPLWDGDPCKLIPSTPLSDDEADALRTCEGPADDVNRFADGGTPLAGHVFFLRHCPSGAVAFAMMREGSARFCSSTAVRYDTGKVVPIQECNTRCSRS
jgi:hypothetical protein